MQIIVDKLRQQWRLNDVIIAMDTVRNLGAFVEFEYAGDPDTIGTAVSALRAAITKIDVELGERDRRGYPYQILKRKK